MTMGYDIWREKMPWYAKSTAFTTPKLFQIHSFKTRAFSNPKIFQIQRSFKSKNLSNPKIFQIQKSFKSKDLSNPKIFQIQRSFKSKNLSNSKIFQIQKSFKSKDLSNPKIFQIQSCSKAKFLQKQSFFTAYCCPQCTWLYSPQCTWLYSSIDACPCTFICMPRSYRSVQLSCVIWQCRLIRRFRVWWRHGHSESRGRSCSVWRPYRWLYVDQNDTLWIYVCTEWYSDSCRRAYVHTSR